MGFLEKLAETQDFSSNIESLKQNTKEGEPPTIHRVGPAKDPRVIGGELLPIETTSLLLASVQSFSWMIPVVLSAIGIGLFIFRKSENS